MRNILIAAFLCLFCLLSVSAEEADPETKPAQPKPETKPKEPASPCPRIEIGPPPQGVLDGQPVMFLGKLTGGDPSVSPQIVWNVSSGLIRAGQGSPRIVVDTTGAGDARQIMAEMWVGGYPAECGYQSVKTSVRVIPPAKKADEFGDDPADKEKDRVAYLAAYLVQTTDRVYVIAYAGRNSMRNYAYESLKRLRAEFIENGVVNQRIGAIDGGFREKPAFELWIVPEGSALPRPTPTVDRKEIVYPRTTPTRKP